MKRQQNSNKSALYAGQRRMVGDRLREYMREHHLRQVDILTKAEPFFTDKVKVTKTDLSQYINNKTEPRSDKLHILAQALDVDEAWLLGFEEGEPDIKLAGGADDFDNQYYPEYLPFMVPVLKPVVSRDYPLEVGSFADYKDIAFPELSFDDLYAVRCPDGALAPTIPAGALVLFYEKKKVPDGKIAVALLPNGPEHYRVFIRRVEHANGETLLLANDPRYLPIVVNSKSKAKIIGQAVKVDFYL